MTWIKTEESLTAVLNNRSYTLRREHPNYRLVVEAIKDGRSEDEIAKLMDVVESVRDYVGNGVEVKGGRVFYRGEEVQGTLVDRLLGFMEEGLPSTPYVRFLENLMQNPSSRSRSQLYKFLEHQGLPITEDGCFLAYKGVTQEYYDRHTGKISNRIGQRITMDRSRISDDPSVGCHTGLHVGSERYAVDFGERTVICKINPKDVVSVPLDCECQKMRVCAYEVTADYAGTMSKTFTDSTDGISTGADEYDWNYELEDETGAKSESGYGSNGFVHQV